jgi:putative spermidine/putrescine transport system permease protein
LQSIPLETLIEASRSLGASWFKSLYYVIIPAVRSATLGGIFITIALSLGEYTLAVLLHFHTFPTWVTNVAQQNIRGSVSLSVVTLLGAWILLVIIAITTQFKVRSAKKQEIGISHD